MAESPMQTVSDSFNVVAARQVVGLREIYEHIGMLTSWTLRDEVTADLEAQAAPVLINRNLLRNALDTCESALVLMREGFRLQPGVVLRPVVESLSYVVHLEKHPGDLGRFKAHKLSSDKALRTAVALAPNIAQFWGLLSKHYSHIGAIYSEVHTRGPYEREDEALALNLQLLTSTMFLLGVVAEFAMFAAFHGTCYFWTRVAPSRLQFALSEPGQRWCKAYLPENAFPNTPLLPKQSRGAKP